MKKILLAVLLLAAGVAIATPTKQSSLPPYDPTQAGLVPVVASGGVLAWTGAGGISGAATSARQVIAGTGLTGGGALTSDVTLSANLTGPASSTNNDVCVWNGSSGGVIADGGVPLANVVQVSRQVLAGAGLTGGGALTSDVTLSAKLTGPAASTNADLCMFSGTSGGSVVDSGINAANVVQTSRQVIAGTGITVGPQSQLTSDITVSMSTSDNQPLTMGGPLTAASGITVATGAIKLTGPDSSVAGVGPGFVVPTSQGTALGIWKADGTLEIWFSSSTNRFYLNDNVTIINSSNTTDLSLQNGGKVHTSGNLAVDGRVLSNTFCNNANTACAFTVNSDGTMNGVSPTSAGGAAAGAGQVGSFAQSNVPSTSAVAGSAGVSFNVTSTPAPLAAGDWDLSATVCYLTGLWPDTNPRIAFAITSSSATVPFNRGLDTMQFLATNANAQSFDACSSLRLRALVSTSTTYYLTANCGSNCSLYGTLSARLAH